MNGKAEDVGEEAVFPDDASDRGVENQLELGRGRWQGDQLTSKSKTSGVTRQRHWCEHLGKVGKYESR